MINFYTFKISNILTFFRKPTRRNNLILTISRSYKKLLTMKTKIIKNLRLSTFIKMIKIILIRVKNRNVITHLVLDSKGKLIKLHKKVSS